MPSRHSSPRPQVQPHTRHMTSTAPLRMCRPGTPHMQSKGRRRRLQSLPSKQGSCSIPAQCACRPDTATNRRHTAWTGPGRRRGSLMGSARTPWSLAPRRTQPHTGCTPSMHHCPRPLSPAHTVCRPKPAQPQSGLPCTAHTVCSRRHPHPPNRPHSSRKTSTVPKRTAPRHIRCTTMSPTQLGSSQPHTQCSRPRHRCLACSRMSHSHKQCSHSPRRSLWRQGTSPPRS